MRSNPLIRSGSDRNRPSYFVPTPPLIMGPQAPVHHSIASQVAAHAAILANARDEPPAHNLLLLNPHRKASSRLKAHHIEKIVGTRYKQAGRSQRTVLDKVQVKRRGIPKAQWEKASALRKEIGQQGINALLVTKK